MRRRQPLALDAVRGPNEIATHFERDDEFAGRGLDLAGQCCAGATGQQESRRGELAAHGHAVGIACQQGPAKRFVVDAASELRAEQPPCDGGDLPYLLRIAPPFGQLRGDADRLVAGVRGHNHPAEAGVEGENAELVTDRGETRLVLGCDGTELSEQRHGRIEAVLRRAFKPSERARVAAPREDVERWPAQVDTAHFGVAMGTEDVALVPQSDGPAGPEATGAASALIGGIARDPLSHEMIDGRLGIEAQYLVQAGGDDIRYALDGERGLGDVRGQDY